MTTQTDLACALGVDPAMVTRYKRRGMPTNSIEAAQAWKAANVRARVGGKGHSDQKAGEPGYGDHRARREKAEADRAEILSQREREQTLLREPAERAVFEAFRGLRDAAFQALRDAAPKVRDLTEVREIQLALEEEMRQAFLSFDEVMRKRLDDLAKAARP